MPPMMNVSKLVRNLQADDWTITTFNFSYKRKNYIILFEDLSALPLKSQNYMAKLTFLDRSNEKRQLTTLCNDWRFSVGAKELREYLGIEYSPNLGDVLKQFYSYFGTFIPQKRNTHFDEQAKNAMSRQLSRNDHDNSDSKCCFKIMRNGVYNGVQHHRTKANADKAKLHALDLYNYFKDDNTISFCFRETDPLPAMEIIAQFTKTNKLI